MSLKEFAVLMVVCLTWGLHFIVIKIAVSEPIPPLFYAATRVTLVTVLLLPWMKWHAGQMKWIFLGGFCLAGLNYALLFTGLTMTTAAAAAIAVETYMPFSIILSVIVFKEKLGFWRILGIILAFIGVMVIASGKPKGIAGPLYTLGIILLVIAAMSEATGAIIVKKVKQVGPLQLLVWFTFVGSLVLWPLTLIFEDGQTQALSADNRGLFITAILYSAVLASILSHGGYYWLLQRLPIHTVAPSGLMMAVIAVIAAWLILDEPLTLRLIMGGALTLTGIAIILYRNRYRDLEEDDPVVSSDLPQPLP